MKHGPQRALFIAASFMVVGCLSEPGEELLVESSVEAAVCSVPAIDIDRSLFVSPTDLYQQELLRQRFPVSRILKQILASAKVTWPKTEDELWRRWWDMQNSSANAVFPDNPHCDDGSGAINDFLVQCPRNEGVLATASPDSHFAVALVYREDLTPSDGSTCGEARVVIAKPPDATGRNFAIVEASIPNPKPGLGVAGCRKIAEFWAGLSAIEDFSKLLDALERFYFTGLTQVKDGVVMKPVLDAENLGLPDPPTGGRRGQIRTNEFIAGPNPRIWQLREFQLDRQCTHKGCKLVFEPVTVKRNPWSGLFNDNVAHPLGEEFREDLLAQLPALAAAQDVTEIRLPTSAAFNAGQSNSQGLENQYVAHLELGKPDGFKKALADRLAALGSLLGPQDIAARATTQSCAGCHRLSNNVPLGGLAHGGGPLIWPSSDGFVHVREDGNLSPALKDVFLPKRKQLLHQFLVDTCAYP